MPAVVELRTDWDAKRGRAAAREAKDADQARRLLAIAAAYEGQDRAAAQIGAMDRRGGGAWGGGFYNCGGRGGGGGQAPGGRRGRRAWVQRFNAAGPQGVIDRKPAEATRRLTPEQEAELAALIEAGPDFARGRGTLALCRPAAGNPDAMEHCLSRAHNRQAVAAARVPAHLGAPAPSRAGPGPDRGVQKLGRARGRNHDKARPEDT